MKKTLKLTTTMVLGIVLWSLLILLISEVSKSDFNQNDVSKQLVAGLAPTIAAFFIFKLIPTVKILKDWNNLSLQNRGLTIWGLVSGDFIFAGVYLFQIIQNKKTHQNKTITD